MAAAPAWPKRIYLHRLHRTLGRSCSLKGDLNHELTHVHES